MQVYNSFNPLVSIILPTFNRKKLLSRAIDSVINQTYNQWELIIADDGSSDNTIELLIEYSKIYQNIRILRHSNRKLPLSLNAGILASCGKFIAFLGSDDELSPTYLEERFNFMMQNGDVDFIHGGVKIIGNPYVKDKNDLSKEIHISECIVGGTFFAKKEVFIKLNGFNNINYSEDSELFERVKNQFNVIKVDLSPYIYYRDTADGICNTVKLQDENSN